MKLNELRILKEMTVAQAVEVFTNAGFDPQGKTPADIKRAYRRIIFHNHPDRGGNEALAKQINQAYGLIKDGVHNETTPNSEYWNYPGGRPSDPGKKKAWDDFWRAADARREQQNRERERQEQNAGWAQAGHSGGMPNSSHIYRQDYTDMNFIKKTMWEKAGKHTNEEWTIQGYDGAFFRNTLTVYGASSIFKDMAEAMRVWQTKGGNPYRCEAVFVSPRRGKDLYLIWVSNRTPEGIDLSKDPVKLTHDSFNQNARNDQQFMRSLPGLLDKIRAKEVLNRGQGRTQRTRGAAEDHQA